MLNDLKRHTDIYKTYREAAETRKIGQSSMGTARQIMYSNSACHLFCLSSVVPQELEFLHCIANIRSKTYPFNKGMILASDIPGQDSPQLRGIASHL